MANWEKTGGHKVADSCARTNLLRTKDGASIQPTRNPGAKVLENEPRYMTFSGSIDFKVGKGSPSRLSRPYGLSSTTSRSSSSATARISRRLWVDWEIPDGFEWLGMV